MTGAQLVALGLVLSLPGYSAEVTDGGAIFKEMCAACHRPGSGTRAPLPAVLREMTQESILRALDTGNMRDQGLLLSAEQRQAVVEYLGKASPTNERLTGFCSVPSSWAQDAPAWNGWGASAANNRFQPEEVAKLGAKDVPKLKLKWAFGYPASSAINAQPTLFAGRIFVGIEEGSVYSLDAQTGCIYWAFKAPVTVRAAAVIDPTNRMAVFGDVAGNLYATNAQTGTLIWKERMDEHVGAKITASPQMVGERLYVPVSSDEEGRASNPHYPCCTFRGSVVAVDLKTGKQIWKTYTIPEKPHQTSKNRAGIQNWGPSGAAVWSTPTADLKRRAIYVATGNSYSDPPDLNSDAVMALDMESGRRLWSRQLTPGDRWNIACLIADTTNCPPANGDDYDFGSPPILCSRGDGRELLVIGQKSGMVHALDPDRQGEIVWQTRIGLGGPLGGIEWGGAADHEFAYFPLSDWHDSQPEVGGGLFALRIATGEKVWHASPPKPACVKLPGCSAAQFTPATAIPGVVFVGSQDGHLRAYDASNGSVLWDFDTVRDFESVDGIKAHGGSIGAPGPVTGAGMVFLDAGYGGLHGNVLLAFSIDGK